MQERETSHSKTESESLTLFLTRNSKNNPQTGEIFANHVYHKRLGIQNI